MKLNLVVAEAALELVPKELQRAPAVLKDSQRRRTEPSRILLDRSFHHSAMQELEDGFKRGRPDLVHSVLLSATSSPSYLDGYVKVYVHTRNDVVFEVSEKTRLPKSYLRFRGLMEKLLLGEAEADLIMAYGSNLNQLVKRIGSDFVWGLSTQGASIGLRDLSGMILSRRKPTVVVGGFPHGHFTPDTLKVMNEVVRIHSKSLDAHVVVSRLLYEVENRRDEGTNDLKEFPRPRN